MYVRKRSSGAAFVGIALALACTAAPAPAAVITFASRAAFDTAFPGLPLENFEEARVAAGGFGLMPNPLDSSTSNPIFSPGEILDGLRIRVGTSPFFDPNNMFIAGPGFATYVSKAVSYNGSDTLPPKMTVEFYNNDVNAFGLDLTSNPNGNTVMLTLFSGTTSLGTFTVTNVQGSGTFFGAFNDDLGQPITRLELNSAMNFFGLDNVAFGPAGGGGAVPEPSSLLLGAFGVLALLATGRGRQWLSSCRAR